MNLPPVATESSILSASSLSPIYGGISLIIMAFSNLNESTSIAFKV